VLGAGAVVVVVVGLLVPLTAVLVVVDVGAVVLVVVVGLLVPLVVVLVVTGAVVPLTAVPEPLTVAALTVVDPDAVTSPEPLLVALTVVDPDALVIAVCASAGLPRLRLSRAALTAAARVLFEFRIFTIVCVSFRNSVPKNAWDC
jgi:hypothetical protein